MCSLHTLPVPVWVSPSPPGPSHVPNHQPCLCLENLITSRRVSGWGPRTCPGVTPASHPVNAGIDSSAQEEAALLGHRPCSTDSAIPVIAESVDLSEITCGNPVGPLRPFHSRGCEIHQLLNPDPISEAYRWLTDLKRQRLLF